jgi:hypothetical protein
MLTEMLRTFRMMTPGTQRRFIILVSILLIIKLLPVVTQGNPSPKQGKGDVHPTMHTNNSK